MAQSGRGSFVALMARRRIQGHAKDLQLPAHDHRAHHLTNSCWHPSALTNKRQAGGPSRT
jgi:hypothetical protein